MNDSTKQSERDIDILSSEAILVRVERHFDLPSKTVFDAWLDSKNIGKWLFATPDGEMVRAELDPRVGGEFTIVEKRGDILAEHFGTYVTIEPPRKIAFQFTTSKSATPTLVTVEITPAANGCDLVLTHAMDPEWADYKDRVQNGWNMIVDSLKRTISTV